MSVAVRGALPADLDRIDAILIQGRTYLREQGLTQWQNGYGPSRADAARDIDQRNGYVLTVGGEISGYAALIQGLDPYYEQLISGQWAGDYPAYASIHRVALDASMRGKGLAAPFLCRLAAIAYEKGVYDTRIDTHPRNAIMQKAIARAHFIYRGVVSLPMPEGERWAYQLLTERVV